ncbi:glutamate decarboxylase 1 isoform X2 [Dunckerocampus dactyliophorus]|uniref:glutamate decarboxylase 1 isoform X2 n=1 Tax=Dunckerocampus dactyliophorus TaxID=161453 RepID=UPI002405CF5E|nr:glutamate decarboxylase 1 isoform X2 [Dunckerocampus dactyliophorus]
MDFLRRSGRVTGKSTKIDKQSEESVQENTQTLPDFSNIYSKDLLPTPGGEKMTRKFLQELVNLLMNYICKSCQRNSKVLDFHHPHQLIEGLEGFSLDLPEKPDTLEQILVDCRDTLKYGINTGHPRFFNQLFAGLDVIGVAGEWLTSTANTNMFTYEVSPVFTLMEEVLMKKMQSIVGWSDDEGDGIFSPGGAISNLYSMLVARYYFYPEVKTKGMGALPQLALFTSEHSHYSLKKSAAVLGLGTDNVFVVKCDERGKMIPEELEASILAAEEKNKVPFYVNATAGTTLYGAFDPLPAIAEICQRHTLWMHVDASWGGGLLLSDRHRMKLQGIERAWSVTWNPHKMMSVPLQCSVMLIKKKGTEGFGVEVNKCLENAEYLYDLLQRRKDFELVFKHKPEASNVCFWYIPPSLRSMPPGPDRDKRLHQVAPQIKGRLMEKGSVLIGYQPTGTKVNFFRCAFVNRATQKEDIDFLLEEIALLGHDL